MQDFAAAAHGPSPVFLVVITVGGLVALWCGVNWAFDVRGITTHRSERIRRRNEETWTATGRPGGSPTFFASVGRLRFLGALLAFTGSVMLLAAYALWSLN
ncbi:hypothetical protein [Streptomyces sp. NPDC046759]|uniref:hypothetical protein n=1 Tax=Streptomyces sp. NPDC046759 TaxID=3155019 RepID=UPI00340CF628